ncbi:hypothetical protein NL349_28900, partial [Klebsiella pneumoniae]|nr:hypothetical protein [Klebsiella pneumoniae]
MDTSAQSPDLQQVSLAVATEPGAAAEGSQAKSAYADWTSSIMPRTTGGGLSGGGESTAPVI